MAKKRTSVMLPGSVSDLADLVHKVQRGDNSQKEEPKEEPRENDKTVEKPEAQDVDNEQQTEREEPVRRGPGRPAKTYQGGSPTEKAERDYHIIRDKGSDSWDLFLALARDYKTRDSHLATIYIDNDLKRILDRLKTASSVQLPTAAILSGIVARFIFDHKEHINDAIFSDRLL